MKLNADLHDFPPAAFGSKSDLIHPTEPRNCDTLIIGCSEQGTALDKISFGNRERFVILQHIGASIPSRLDCQTCDDLSMDEVERLFDKYEFRHVIICGHVGCQVIPSWLRPINSTFTDIGRFRRRFENGTRDLVDKNYSPKSVSDRQRLMICEHVLCQLENLLTHQFVLDRTIVAKTYVHGWIIDDETARVFAYCPETNSFERI